MNLPESANELLRVEDVSKSFDVRVKGKKASLKAVRHVSFSLNRGETLGIVGESGCGKSTLGRVIMRLIEPTTGKILFDGKELTALSSAELQKERRNFQMVFQDPYAAFDPRMNIKAILEEPLRTHGINRDTWAPMIHDLLGTVGLPTDALARYPHEFSGGQRQRISIARALLLNPKMIVADEPVAALDVSIQAQILNLMHDLQEKYRLAMIFIAHNLATVQYISHRIAVMYLGQIVEIAGSDELYDHPQHPYTQALISAIPVPVPGQGIQRARLGGEIPSPLSPPSGCPFRTRCPHAEERCAKEAPALTETAPNHFVACFRYVGQARMEDIV